MVELRKRKAPAPPPVVEKKSKPAPKPKVTDTPKETPTEAPKKPTVPEAGDTINLDDFGGEIETNDGTKTTLKKLVEESKSGVVLFTYPKASTPGCTKQVCLFRDNYTHLTSTGLSIYGLSADSPKANTTFKTKQNLSYSLLCDPSATLIGAIGFKKAPKGTTRGVFAVDKKGKVLIREAGGPDATVDAVQKLVARGPDKSEAKEEAGDDAEAK
ncbi:Putative Disrupter of telomere silencing protein [Penicillium brasilianum]|uniref:thioredoxin-dependent peroxiredoxin n=1 Tax=Penicillium brasilianum TaxID=104259 RepID=A0A0F7VK99_PENBI|nr:Putative Disrupter of telomere silencing protein [Penicillium brasilianum]